MPPQLQSDRIRDCAGGSFSEKGGDNVCITLRLGCSEQGQKSEREMAHLATEHTHKLLRTVNSTKQLKMFAVPKEPPHFYQIRQHKGGGICKLPGRHTFSSASQSGMKSDCVGHEAFSFTMDNACPGNNECGADLLSRGILCTENGLSTLR